MGATNHSVSGVLEIDDKILKQLEKAETKLNNLKTAADALEKSFSRTSSAASQFANTVNRIKMPKMNLNLGIGTANKDLTRLTAMLGKMDFGGPFDKATDAVNKLSDALETCKNNARDLVTLAKQLGQVFTNPGGSSGNGGLGPTSQSINDIDKDAKELLKTLTAIGAMDKLKKWVSSAVEIRGEFEMAQRSLGFIIGDIAKSEEIFSRIKELAVVSPFEVGDLVKQTRQLAAYGIETEKLSDTVKRLGDIASGVGVDMGRLILAYGQVRAAQFLRLTEVRQFTEAGVDVLGGLAQYFSEVEHRAVSVGDVMARITKKLVTFSDVEVVISRMTSAGGKFYQMQEKQADTIQGTISNLKDRWNIEMNDWLSSYDGLVKGALNITQSLIKALFVIGPAITSVLGGAAIAVGITKVTKAMIALKASLNGVVGSALKIGGWAGAVFALAAAIGSAVVQLTAFKRELNEMNADAASEAEKLVNRYRELAETIKNTADGSDTQRKAMEALRAEYGNIIPAIDLEAQSLTNLTNKYDSHVAAIRAYVAEKTNQRKLELLFSKLDETNTEQSIASSIRTKDSAQRKAKGRFTGEDDATRKKYSVEEGVKELQTTVDDVAAVLYEAYRVSVLKVLDKSIAGDRSSIYWDIAKQITQYYGKETPWLDTIIETIARRAEEILEDFNDANAEGASKIDLGAGQYNQELVSRIRTISDMTYSIRDALKASGMFKDNVAQLDLAVDEILAIYGKVLKAKALDPDLDLTQFMTSLTEALPFAKEKSGAASIADATSTAFKEAVGSIDWEAAFRGSASEAGVEWWKTVDETLENEGERTSIEDMMLQRISQAVDAQSLTKVKKRIKELLGEIYNDYAEMPIKLPEQQERQSLGDYAKTVYNTLQEARKEQEILDSASGDRELKDSVLDRYFGDRQKLDDYSAALARLWAALSPFYDPPKTSGGGSGNKKNWVEELAEAVAKFPAQSYNKTVAQVNQLKKSITEMAGKAKIDIDTSKLDDREGVRDILEKLGPSLQAGKKDKLLYQVQLEFDEQDANRLKKRADTLFGDLKIAMDFEGKGLSMEDFDSKAIIGQIGQIEERLRGLGDNLGADSVRSKLIEQMKAEQKKIVELIAKWQTDVTQKSASTLTKAVNDVRQIGGVNKNSGSTGLNVPDDAQVTAIFNRIRKAMQDVNREQYDILRSSEFYIASFNDLDAVSYTALVSLKKMLEQVRANTDLTDKDQRQLERQILAVEERMGEMNGGKRSTLFLTMFKQWSEMNKGMKSLGGTRDSYVVSILERTEAQEELNRVTEEYKSIIGVSAGQELTEEQRANLESMAEYQSAVKRVEKATDAANTATENYRNSVNRVKNAQKVLKAQLQRTQSAFSEMEKLISGTIELCEGLAEGFGITFDDEHTDAVEAFLKGFELMSQGLALVAGGVTMVNLLMDVLNIKADELLIKLWPLAIVAAALGAAMAAIKIVDNQKKAQVEMHLDTVESLSEAYDDLYDSMSKVASATALVKAYKDATENLHYQLRELEAARREEESRGRKAEEETLDDIDDKIKEARENLKDAQTEFYSNLGAPDDWTKEADDWASAWLDAFKEGESGVESLRNSFDDLLDDIISKQLKLKVLAPLLAEFENATTEALEDGVISRDEYSMLRKLKEQTSVIGNAMLQDLLDQMGYEASKTQAESTLSQSIQGITESTADALEGIMNSQRLYSADTNRKVTELLSMLSDRDGGANPVLSELKAQTSVLRDIYRILSDNTKSGGHKLGGGGFKTFSVVS